jgi:hypothetical protein
MEVPYVLFVNLSGNMKPTARDIKGKRGTYFRLAQNTVHAYANTFFEYFFIA